VRETEWEEKAPCIRCAKVVPVSVNTIQVDGVTCMHCQVSQPSPRQLRGRLERRYAELTVEKRRLEELLGLTATMQATP
jgi:hypothetical protein